MKLQLAIWSAAAVLVAVALVLTFWVMFFVGYDLACAGL